MSTKLAKSGVLIQTKQIRTPDNFAALLVEPRIKRLAASIKGVTQIAPIVVQPLPGGDISGGRYKIWAGHDRFAAVTIAGKQTIRADIRTGSDPDFLLLQIAENDDRRHRAELVSAFDEAVAKTPESLETGGLQKGDLYPPSKAEKRAAIAEAKGITPAAVKQAERRAARAAEKEPAEEPTAPAPTLDLLGCDDASARAVAKYARKDQEAIDEAVTALGRLTPCPAFKQLRELVQAARPHSLCPWCKGLPRALGLECQPCGGLGYVSWETRYRAPETLRDGPLAVLVDGVFYPYEDVRDGKVKPGNGKPVKTGKGITVVTTDGTEADLDAV